MILKAVFDPLSSSGLSTKGFVRAGVGTFSNILRHVAWKDFIYIFRTSCFLILQKIAFTSSESVERRNTPTFFHPSTYCSAGDRFSMLYRLYYGF